jgi:hypothetical protein
MGAAIRRRINISMIQARGNADHQNLWTYLRQGWNRLDPHTKAIDRGLRRDP